MCCTMFLILLVMALYALRFKASDYHIGDVKCPYHYYCIEVYVGGHFVAEDIICPVTFKCFNL